MNVCFVCLDTPDKLKDDPEIQAWSQELARSKDNGGVGLKVDTNCTNQFMDKAVLPFVRSYVVRA